jgi:endonuclease/exonuclease/phosphatase family metal-dependent hydrolase
MALAQPDTIVLDGDTAEWSPTAAAYSDEHYLYTRFTISGEQITLQAAPQTVALFIDADGNPATGVKRTDPALEGLGIDLEVLFSPPGARGVGVGVELFATPSDGKRTKLSSEDFDFVFAPTYASSWYEARICRTPDDKAGLPATGLLGPGTVKGIAAVIDDAGKVVAACEPFSLVTDEVCEGGKRLKSAFIPSKPANAIRVMNWNIELSKPVENPAPFARIIKATNPDVVLLQEWEAGDASLVKQWFTTNIGGEWNVVKAAGNMSNGGGVAIASRFELARVEGDVLTAKFRNNNRDNEDKAVRFVAATANTPIGPILFGSTHFKSRGSINSVEDRRRMAEARAINTFLAKQSTTPMRIVGGDLNLVGSRPPLDLLRAGLDADGSDLNPVDAMVMGDNANYTWKNYDGTFTPGRLDWVVYSDSALTSLNAFSLDTRRLAPASLTPLNLEPRDSAASDHLPIVFDVSK